MAGPDAAVRLVVTSTIAILLALPVALLSSEIALERRLRASECTVLGVDSDFRIDTRTRRGSTRVTGADAYLRLTLEHVVDGRSWAGEAKTDSIRAGSEEEFPTFTKGQKVECWYDPENLEGTLWLRKVSWRDGTFGHVMVFLTLWVSAALLLVKRRAVESAISVVPSAYLMAALGLVAMLLAFLPTPDIPFPIRVVLVAAGFMAMFRGLKLLTLSER